MHNIEERSLTHLLDGMEQAASRDTVTINDVLNEFGERLVTCVILPVGWPLLEFVPFASSFGGGTVALFAFGLFTRDGLYVLLGYLTILLTSLTFYAVIF